MDRTIGRDCPDPGSLAALIAALPPGATGVYFHPVICEGIQLFNADLVTLPGARSCQPQRKRQINCCRPVRSARERAR
jgi:hypothetical protein